MSMYIPIVTIGLFALGWFVWMTFFHKKFAAKYAAAGSEAQQKFDENKDAILTGYLNDTEKYGILKEAVGDEDILGMACFVEPKTVGKSLTEGLKTSITRVRKVNMDLFYMVITDKYLHCIESDGEHTVDHVVYELDKIESPSAGKASPLNVKNAVTGVSGDLNQLSFTYKGKKYSYNLYKYLFGYPCFSVTEDTLSDSFGRHFPGKKTQKMNSADPEFMLESLVHGHFYDGFKKAAQDKLRIVIP